MLKWIVLRVKRAVSILNSVLPPVSYVERDWINMPAKVTYLPTRSEIPVICEVDKIVEFYSR